MLEVKYFKDYKHNYMILQCGQAASSRSYQYKILTSDKIKEILRCSVRHINGTTYYYYDITSRTTLKNLFQSTRMSCEQVKDLLCQLHGICDKLAGFFMEEAGLVLLPEHIYYDISAQRYIGLYYPDYQVTGAQAYEPLMNFLLEHIDAEDRQLAEDIYRICELAGEPNFLLEDALQILEERNEIREDVISNQTELYTGMAELPVDKPADLQEEKPGPKRNLFYPVFALLSVLGIAGAAAVYSMFELVQEEEIALFGIIAVLGVCFLFSLWGILRENKRKKKAEGKPPEAADRLFEEPSMGMTGEISGIFESESRAPDSKIGQSSGRMKGTVNTGRGVRTEVYDETDKEGEESNVRLDNVISRDMSLDMIYDRDSAIRDGGAYGTQPGRAYGRNIAVSSPAAVPYKQEPDYYGNTIFFDESRAAEYKLYAVDRRNKQHIELKQFPCTIGKMAGCVDYVLADNSVSRIHAKFDRQGDRVLLTDMNSTNGTFKNGLRMQPQETVEIEPGDEIRFGNLNYCYR